MCVCVCVFVIGRKHLHRMFIEHDRKKLIHRQNPLEWFCSQKLHRTLWGYHITQRPVRIVRFHQVVYIRHCFLWVIDLHSLATNITGRKKERGGVRRDRKRRRTEVESIVKEPQTHMRSQSSPSSSTSLIRFVKRRLKKISKRRSSSITREVSRPRSTI